MKDQLPASATVYENLDKQVTHSEQEARMILPGIQALFGFQLVAVFNSGFKGSLTSLEQKIHLAALFLVAIATLLVLMPAAYHRQAEPRQISPYFAQLASVLITWGLVPLMLGMSLDFYLICRMILDNVVWSALISGILMVCFTWGWFLFPLLKRRQRNVSYMLK